MKRSGPLDSNTPLKRGKPLKRTGGLSPVSDSRRERDDNYPTQRRKAWQRANGLCEANATARCAGKAQECHHIAGRGGEDPHRLGNLMAVCSMCHLHIHAHPAESYEQGWMEKRLGGDGG